METNTSPKPEPAEPPMTEPKEESAAPTVATPVPAERSSKPRETPSIFNRKKPNEEVSAEASSVTEKRSKAFDDQALQEAWKGFAAEKGEVADTDKLILNRKISQGPEHKVIIHLASQLEVSFLEKLEVELIQYFRSTLENDHVTIEREVIQEVETKKLYTSKDIFEHMAKENPALKDLKDRLGLDFDY